MKWSGDSSHRPKYPKWTSPSWDLKNWLELFRAIERGAEFPINQQAAKLRAMHVDFRFHNTNFEKTPFTTHLIFL